MLIDPLWPKYEIEGAINLHLEWHARKPAFSNHSRTHASVSVCSLSVAPVIRTLAFIPYNLANKSSTGGIGYRSSFATGFTVCL